MFINLKVLKKLMKEGYKGSGLRVAMVSGGIDAMLGLFLANGGWAVWIDQENIPKPVKGLVVELAGRLPENGEYFKTSKHMEYPVSMTDEEVQATKGIVIGMHGLGEKMDIIPMTYRSISLLRTIQSRTLVGISSDLLMFYDINSIGLDAGESTPTGPCLADDDKSVFWYNSLCTLAIAPMAINLSLIRNALSDLDVHENGFKERPWDYTVIDRIEADGKEDPADGSEEAGTEDGDNAG